MCRIKAVQHYRYQLKPQKKHTPARSGALLKVIFDDELTGYADCHPWPELGDDLLDQQLHNFPNTSLTARSFHYARVDAEARVRGLNLMEELTVPSSHYLAIDALNKDNLNEIHTNGYQVIKLKVGRDVSTEINQLQNLATTLFEMKFSIRLDCNEKFGKTDFYRFMDEIQEVHHLIDFIEDPYPYNPVNWKQTREHYSIPIACDRQAKLGIHYPESFDVLIWKPAVEELYVLPQGKRLVVTSYLDHPLGQTVAMYEAAKHCKGEICGLESHHVYESTSFSRSLLKKGTGFGFDPLLAALEWKDV